jgi:chromosome transmission fidelity protein 1
VIPLQNLLPITISTGPTGIPLNFSFKTRFKNEVIIEAGRVILNLCQIVPKGLIAFFPSYSYMEKVIEIWKSVGILKQLSQKKDIFMESVVLCDGDDDLLSRYSRAVDDPQKVCRRENNVSL